MILGCLEYREACFSEIGVVRGKKTI